MEEPLTQYEATTYPPKTRKTAMSKHQSLGRYARAEKVEKELRAKDALAQESLAKAKKSKAKQTVKESKGRKTKASPVKGSRANKALGSFVSSALDL